MDWGRALAEGGAAGLDSLLDKKKKAEEQASQLALYQSKKEQSLQDDVAKALLVETMKGLNRKGQPGVSIDDASIAALPETMQAFALSLRNNRKASGGSAKSAPNRPSLFVGAQPTANPLAAAAAAELARRNGGK